MRATPIKRQMKPLFGRLRPSSALQSGRPSSSGRGALARNLTRRTPFGRWRSRPASRSASFRPSSEIGNPMQRAFIIRPFGKKKDRAGREVDFERVHGVLIEPALKAVGLGGGTTGEII